MRARMQYISPKHVRIFCDAPTDRPSGDPTGTFDIRRKYRNLAAGKFRKARAALQKAVVDEDVLGLKAGSTSPLALAGAAGNKEEAFKSWTVNLLTRTVLGDGMWMRPMLTTAYVRAVKRALRLTKSNNVPSDAVDTINVLVALCKTEMQGIIEAVVQRVTRAAAHGWLHNDTPAQAFVEIDAAIRSVGISRSAALIEMMTVKVFNIATLDQFEVAGRKHVGVVPETIRKRGKDALPSNLVRVSDIKGFTGYGSLASREQTPSRSTIRRITKQEEKVESLGSVNVETAGDDDVCVICEDIADEGPYNIDTARGLIPAHPFCRCAFVPEDDEEGDDSSGGGFLGSLVSLGRLLFGKLFDEEQK